MSHSSSSGAPEASGASTQSIRRAALSRDPLELFDSWLRRADETPEVQYPGAMCLSTVDRDGRPQGRFVIAHRVDRAFVFLTDSRSPKALALAAEPRAALTAYWGRPLELQVRIEGRVEEAAPEVADSLFGQRPRRSQVTPWASRQSRPTSLEELQAAVGEVDRRFVAAESLPRPETWRGYRLEPDLFEFWWARPRRLHDRFRYRLEEGGVWRLDRLSP